MPSQDRKVYAIRVGEFVELRSAKNGITIKTSKLTRKANETDYDYGYQGKKVVLKQVFFVGGVVLGYTRLTNFARRFNKAVPKDKLVELSPIQAASVLDPAWRKKNL